MLTGFLLPPLWLTSNTITPKQVLRYHRFSSAGVVYRVDKVPSFLVPVLCISYVDARNHKVLIKGILKNQKEKKSISHKTFEPLFFDFADWADLRWLFTGAEIPADSTTPDREWQGFDGRR